jgi:hypothetical protein
MTEFDPTPDPIGDWRRLVEALEDIVETAEPEAAGAPEGTADVRRLVALRLAACRRDRLPAFWVRRGRAETPGPDIADPPETTQSDPPSRPPDARVRPRPLWRE